MTHDYPQAVARIRAGVDQLEAREPMTGRERIVLWQDVRQARAELDVILRDLEADATEAIVEISRESGEDELETMLGVVHVGWTQPTERWRGHDLIGKLAETVLPVDARTGELADQPVRAVPVDVLRDVIAGCQTDALTSSKWRKTGLRKYVDDLSRWYDRDDPQPVIRTGPKR